MNTDGCPFHDLDPTEVVWLVFDDASLPFSAPYSAERACSEYHLAAAMAPVIDRAMTAIAERIDAEIEASR